MTASLPKPLRKQPENTIKAARDAADLAFQRLAQKDTAIEVDSDQIRYVRHLADQQPCLTGPT
jgi:hypothetical protein